MDEDDTGDECFDFDSIVHDLELEESYTYNVFLEDGYYDGGIDDL